MAEHIQYSPIFLTERREEDDSQNFSKGNFDGLVPRKDQHDLGPSPDKLGKEPEAKEGKPTAEIFDSNILATVNDFFIGILKMSIFIAMIADLLYFMPIRLKYFRCSMDNINQAYDAENPEICKNSTYAYSFNPAFAVFRLFYELPSTIIILMSCFSIGSGVISFIPFDKQKNLIAVIADKMNFGGYFGFIIWYTLTMLIAYTVDLFTPSAAYSKVPMPEFFVRKYVIFAAIIFVSVEGSLVKAIHLSNIESPYITAVHNQYLQFPVSAKNETAHKYKRMFLIFMSVEIIYHFLYSITFAGFVKLPDVFSYIAIVTIALILLIFTILLEIKVCKKLDTDFPVHFLPPISVISLYLTLLFSSMLCSDKFVMRAGSKKAFLLVSVILSPLFQVINFVFIIITGNIDIKSDIKKLFEPLKNRNVWIYLLSFCSCCVAVLSAGFTFQALAVESQEIPHARFKFNVKFCDAIKNDEFLQKALVSLAGTSLSI